MWKKFKNKPETTIEKLRNSLLDIDFSSPIEKKIQIKTYSNSNEKLKKNAAIGLKLVWVSISITSIGSYGRNISELILFTCP